MLAPGSDVRALAAPYLYIHWDSARGGMVEEQI
jgi:hypothetical protein